MSVEIEDKEARVKALREGLRNGRTNQTGGTVGTDSSNADSAAGTSFQAARGAIDSLTADSGKAQRDDKRTGDNGRGPKAEPIGGRRTDRRPGKGDSGAAPDSAGNAAPADTRSVGRIITDDPIKERIEVDKPDATFGTITPEPPKRGPGRPRKEESQAHEGVKLPWRSKGNLIAERDVAEKTESLAAALESDFQYLDEYLWRRQTLAAADPDDVTNQPVWSDLDQEEITALTRLLVKRATHSEATAMVVNALIDTSDYITVGAIFAPRIQRTVKIMRETRVPRKRRGEQ